LTSPEKRTTKPRASSIYTFVDTAGNPDFGKLSCMSVALRRFFFLCDAQLSLDGRMTASLGGRKPLLAREPFAD
jgi:hypothetical protein